MNSAMQISKPTRTVDGDRSKLTVTVVTGDGSYELYYSVPVECADWFSMERCDGFVVGLLFQAMERNEDIVAEGVMSSRLWHSLSQFYIPMMAKAFPHRHAIKIIPASLTNEQSSGAGVATGFSGGIDSFAAVVQHLNQEIDPDHRISHFVFNNVGSHGHGEAHGARKLFWERFERVKNFAREVGVPILAVDSNLGDIMPIDFVQSHSALNASVPLLLQNYLKRYYYASAYKYADCGVDGIDDLAYFDPLAVHLLSTETLDCVSTGCQMSRVEKTRLVASYEPSYRYLNVCVNPEFEGRNCSSCFKCRRTMLTLQLLGLEHHYRKVFDFDNFAKVRRRYMKEIILHYPKSFEAEIAHTFYAPRSDWWQYLLKAGGWIRKHRQYHRN